MTRGCWLGFAVVLAACNGAPPASTPVTAVLTDGGVDLGDVIYVGQVTDEALRRLLDSPPEDEPAQRLIIDAPTDGQTLAPDPPLAFAYRRMTAQLARPPARRPGPVHRALAELGALFGPERAAYAHGIPFEGTGTWLVISDATGAPGLRVFTDRPAFTPDATQWRALAARPQPLTLSLTWADFDQNRILSGYGPFAGGTVQFRIAPP